LLDRSGVSRSTHYQRIADGLWTRPVAIGARSVGWPESEVTALIGARIAGQSDAEVRDLVKRLEAARKSAQPA
jgi:prophage regulatory protein